MKQEDEASHGKWARFRFSVVGGLLAAPPPQGELRAALLALAAKTWAHPITGVTYVSVHATTGGSCGVPDLSLWGLYRQNDENTLTRLRTSVGPLLSIQKLVDLYGDGQLEAIGSPWLGTETMVIRTTGDSLDSLELPFYGCPC